METISERAGFLCNFEILTILKEQRDLRLNQTKLLESKRKLLSRNGNGGGNHLDEKEEKMRIRPENLNTVTFECIKYLEESIHPLRRQTSTSITTALNDLEKLDLTKSERLQIINLAPTNLCELTVCIEEYEERFPQEHEAESILSIVKKSSSAIIITASSGNVGPKLELIDHSGMIGMEEEEDHPIGEEEEDEFVNEGLAGEGEANVRELDEGE